MRKAASAGLRILALITGALFLYAAYTKLYPIQSFEYTLVEFLRLPWLPAAIAARLIIGLEAALGLLILLQLFGRRQWVLRTAFVLTLLFSAFLVYLWITAGNQVNCGCFGDAIWMSPSASLVKNGLLLLALYVLIRHLPARTFRGARLIAPLAAITALIALFVLFPLPGRQPHWLSGGRYQPDLSALYAPDKADRPQIDLKQGKRILACFTVTCPHCRVAAHKLHLMKQRNPALPFYMVLAGPDAFVKPFFEDTRATDIPYSRLRGQAFVNLAGLEYPAIYWMDKGWIVAKASYVTLDQQAIERWLQAK